MKNKQVVAEIEDTNKNEAKKKKIIIIISLGK